MNDLKSLTEKVLKFRNDREWKKFHNPKDVALSLVLEASEYMEHYQWKSENEIKEYIRVNKVALSDELADVLYWVLLACHDLEINPGSALLEKMKKNEKKYPIRKAKGKHTKYNKL
jgi:NTP pyrophosphatase (non-canonical NTP hydrolase)